MAQPRVLPTTATGLHGATGMHAIGGDLFGYLHLRQCRSSMAVAIFGEEEREAGAECRSRSTSRGRGRGRSASSLDPSNWSRARELTLGPQAPSGMRDEGNSQAGRSVGRETQLAGPSTHWTLDPRQAATGAPADIYEAIRKKAIKTKRGGIVDYQSGVSIRLPFLVFGGSGGFSGGEWRF
jgi:hypothetical protein